MSERVRAFIAVPLPGAVRDAIWRLQAQLARSIPDIRWTRSDNLHLTLRFLGDQPEESLEKLAAVMLSVGSSNGCFQLAFTGIGAFPSWHSGRVIWLGLAQPELVSQLHRHLSGGLLQLGIPEEPRPFRPHLTIGRSRRPTSLPPLPDEVRHQPVAEFTADRMVLYGSRLTPSGARHTEIFSARLAAW